MGEDLIILRDLIDEYKKAIIKDRRICVTEPDIQVLDNILFDYKQKLKALDKSEELIKQLGAN